VLDGSLAREWVRDQYFDKSWDKFNASVEARRPKLATDEPDQAAFYWLLPDIIVSTWILIVATRANQLIALKRIWNTQIHLIPIYFVIDSKSRLLFRPNIQRFVHPRSSVPQLRFSNRLDS
jgi:xylulokinase